MASHPKLEAWWRRASELLASGDHARAAVQLERLVKAAPQELAFRYNLSACLFQLGKPDEALLHLRRAQQLGLIDPAVDTLLERIAIRFHGDNRIDDALAILREAVARRPADAGLLLRTGEMLRDAGCFAEALAVLDRIRLSGRDAAAVENAKGAVHQSAGSLDAARVCFEQALAADPGLIATHKNLRNLSLNTSGLSLDAAFALYRDLAKRSGPSVPLSGTLEDIDRDPARRLRVAYVSSDFRMHVVGLNILPLIENHDPASVELYFYSDVVREDVITERFKAKATRWRSIRGLSDADAASAMRGDRIDVAVFLAGSFDTNRPQIAAYRAAPVQVSYHDCATSGFAEMDYILSDAYLTPPDGPERFTEEIVRLPVFYQYERRAVVESSPPPSRTQGSITFGSFNKPEKINGDVIALWARVLAAVPDSRLMLKYFDYYRARETQARIRAEFAKHGLENDRLVFRTGYDVSGTHLALYDALDIALDTFPFAGATTTFEALSRGVPVVTLWGNRYVSRYAGAIVSHAGFADFACADAEAYIETARVLANDPHRLAELRRILPERIATSLLCDGVAYARSVEAAYRRMWLRFCQRSV